MVQVTIGKHTLQVDVQGLDQLWAFKRRLEIPLSHVKGARTDPANPPRPPLIRALGTHLPGVITAGTYYSGKELSFWDVRDCKKAVIIDLTDERYSRLVLEVPDPTTCVQHIEAAISNH